MGAKARLLIERVVDGETVDELVQELAGKSSKQHSSELGIKALQHHGWKLKSTEVGHTFTHSSHPGHKMWLNSPHHPEQWDHMIKGVTVSGGMSHLDLRRHLGKFHTSDTYKKTLSKRASDYNPR